VFTYSGSGKRWLRHLHKHGKNINTAILEVAKNNNELREKAAFYNKIWNIGNNPLFLNLIPEEGTGGNTWAGIVDKDRARALRSKIQKEFNNTDEGRNIRKCVSDKIKRFNNTIEGRFIRKQVGSIARQNQLGKTMMDRMGDDYIDRRKGKKFHEIYLEGYTHPQQKPFKITLVRTGESWILNNESEFKRKLKLNADPSLRILKQTGTLTIKQVRKTSKHNFLKDDILIFEFLDIQSSYD
jgi:hypothetical protein